MPPLQESTIGLKTLGHFSLNLQHFLLIIVVEKKVELQLQMSLGQMDYLALFHHVSHWDITLRQH